MRSWTVTEWMKIQPICYYLMRRKKNVSIKIKVSYTDERELNEIISMLNKKRVIECKKQPAKGKYKRAYIRLYS